ncbi:MAG: hypothetical protein FWE10_06585 [Rikenellaceae bacterium]|nr:hypothetical protein [Rikenellaceae bacterium]MCL2692484.1 hypothetical protein [Rikenellaceae bacterium]
MKRTAFIKRLLVLTTIASVVCACGNSAVRIEGDTVTLPNIGMTVSMETFAFIRQCEKDSQYDLWEVKITTNPELGSAIRLGERGFALIPIANVTGDGIIIETVNMTGTDFSFRMPKDKTPVSYRVKIDGKVLTYHYEKKIWTYSADDTDFEPASESGMQTNTEAKQTTAPEPAKSNPDFTGLPVKLTVDEKEYIFHDLKVSKARDDIHYKIFGEVRDVIYITAYTKSDVSYSLGEHSSGSDFPVWCVYLGDGAQHWPSCVELKRTDVPDEIALVYGPFSFSGEVSNIVLFEKEKTSNQRKVGYNGDK